MQAAKSSCILHESQSTAVAATHTAKTRRQFGRASHIETGSPCSKSSTPRITRTNTNAYQQHLNAAALDESGNSLAAGRRRSTVHRRAVRVLGIGDGVLQRCCWLGGLEDGSAPDCCAAGHLGRGRGRVSREAGPRAHAAADVGRRRHTRGAGQGRGPLRAATDRKGRVRHGTRPASSIGFSWSAFDHLR